MELLTTEPDSHGDTKRMRFQDIAESGFTWTWSRSAGGEWTELWRIEYRRA
jgi:hypothetical protein